MMSRTHEFLLAGDAQSYDRLGFRYTEGEQFVRLIHPDSQHSEQEVRVPLDAVRELQRYFAAVMNSLPEVGEEGDA